MISLPAFIGIMVWVFFTVYFGLVAYTESKRGWDIIKIMLWWPVAVIAILVFSLWERIKRL